MRFRDNAIVAWASVSSKGATGADEFGVAEVKHERVGAYAISLDVEAASANQLIPMAVPTTATPPEGPEDLRFVTIHQTGPGTFTVYVSSVSGPAESSFVFMATAR
jgi:hypothetical protein